MRTASQDHRVGVRRFPALLAAMMVATTIAVAFAPGPVAADDVDTTADVRQLLENNSTGGTVGLYLKEVGGPVHAAFNESYVFEPASTIKALIHFYAMRQVEDGVTALTDQVPWFTGTSGSCPTLTGPASDTLQVGLQAMMGPSDNRWTQALRELFGDPGPLPPSGPINDTAQALGMADTRLTHLIGCLVSMPPAGYTRGIDDPNRLTLVDAGVLYEAVATGYLQNPAAAYALMLSDAGRFNTVINQEAASLGLSAGAVNDFRTQRRSAAKAGSYGGGGLSYRSVAGWFELAYKDASCAIEPRDFVYGAFIDQATALGTDDIRTFGTELAREQIRHALGSWAACEADLDQGLLSFVGAPAELAVHTPIPVTVRASVRNNGPADPVDGHLTVSATVPADCTAEPAEAEHVVADMAAGAVVPVDSVFTVTCTQPSNHALEIESQLVPLNPAVEDPDPSNNDATTSLVRPVLAHADLSVSGWDFSELDGAGIGDTLVGQTFTFSTPKVLHNAGDTVDGLYDSPVDATVVRTLTVPTGVEGSVEIGVDEAPATVVVERPMLPDEAHLGLGEGAVVEAEGPATIRVTFDADALAAGGNRSIVETFGLRCLEPGAHMLGFSNEVAAVDEHTLDPDPSNNLAEVSREVDCVTPVAVNIRPGNFHNLVNPNSNQSVPVAILSTSVGQYGLPMAFDASSIDDGTARFGTVAVIEAGDGSTPSPAKPFVRDSFEPDDSTKDGDTDMVLHFKLPPSGIVAGTTEACIAGVYAGAGGTTFTFFGCDVVATTT